MSHTEPNTVLDPDNWWRDENLVTYEDLINTGMRVRGIPSQNQLAKLSAKLGYGRGGKGIDRTVFSNLVSGIRRNPQEHTLIFLSEVLGGPMWRWRQASPTGERVTTWKPPVEVNSPFATQRVRYAHSDLIRGIHEQSVKAYCDGFTQGQHDFLAQLKAAGWNTSEMEQYIVQPDEHEIGRIPSTAELYDPNDAETAEAV